MVSINYRVLVKWWYLLRRRTKQDKSERELWAPMEWVWWWVTISCQWVRGDLPITFVQRPKGSKGALNLKKGNFGKKALQYKCPKEVSTGCGLKAGRRPGGRGVADSTTEKLWSEFTLGQIRGFGPLPGLGRDTVKRILSRKKIESDLHFKKPYCCCCAENKLQMN